MEDRQFDELMHRLQTLEGEKKRWRLLALLASAALALVLVCGGVSSLGFLSVYWSRTVASRQMEMQMMQEAQMAREQAEQARLQAEQALQDAKDKQNNNK